MSEAYTTFGQVAPITPCGRPIADPPYFVVKRCLTLEVTFVHYPLVHVNGGRGSPNKGSPVSITPER